MITPQKYYIPDELPNRRSKKRIWQGIKREIAPHRGLFFFIEDKRSFAYGFAAAVLLYLASVGAFQVARNAIETAQPPVVKIDRAYRSAIDEFERVVPAVAAYAPQTPQASAQRSSRTEQLRLVDDAIHELRQQTNGNDISPITRERLRQFYGAKLLILQQMIEQGEIGL
ncbi:MAG: hypothetical protein FJ217_17105 [Ignavibacteria bacterium]|nr:hypothetical protein [Ignavibacteria bacterium]